MKPLAPSQRASLEAATRAFEAALRGVDLEGRALDTGPATEVIAYLKTRGFTGETAKRFRLGAVPHGYSGFERFAGRLAIPSICASGHVVSLKFRALDDEAEPKYDTPAGLCNRLFNLRALSEDSTVVVLTEGEADAITVAQLGFPAVGIQGVKSWKPHHPTLFEGYDRVVFIRDMDDAGFQLSKRLMDTDLPIEVVEPPAKDANEALRMGLGEELARMIRGDHAG